MPIDARPIVTAIADHWPQVVFGYAVLRDAAKPIAKYLQDRYKHDSPDTLKQAADNASDLAHRLEAKLKSLLESGHLTDAQLKEVLARPDVAAMLQDVFIAASESASQLQHEQFAKLIATHLVAGAESLQSKVLRMATERVRFLTDRQLKTLGLIHTLTQVRFEAFAGESVDERIADYSSGLADLLRPYDDIYVRLVDVEHMEGLSLLSINWSAAKAPSRMIPDGEVRSQLLAPLYSEFYGQFVPMGQHSAPPVIQRIQELMVGDRDPEDAGVRAITLFTPGSVIGSAVYANFKGEPLDVSWLT
jgi:hypothetical protein